MKAISRLVNASMLLALALALGAVGVTAQNPCEDADGMTKSGDNVRELYKDKSIPGLEKFVEAGKSFVEKFGACEPAKELADWLKRQLPRTEQQIKDRKAQEIEDAMVKRFDDALKAKNWDEVYAAGKEILAKYPEKYRTVEVVLAAAGGEEALKGNMKFADESIRFAKQSITDLESGKSFMVGDKERIGLSVTDNTGKVLNFAFPNRNDAAGWMNLYIGFITFVGKKDKAGALPYLYKSTQATSESATFPVAFELVGNYYFDELNKLVEEIQKLDAAGKRLIDEGSKLEAERRAPGLTPEQIAEKTKLIDEKVKALEENQTAIKGKVAMSNGTAERAMDAFSRAYTLGKDAAYKARMKKNVEDAYNVRFGKKEPVDSWIATAVKKPFPNPTTPITPISDEPTKTDGSGGAMVSGNGNTAANGTGVGTANGTGVGAASATGVGAANGTGVSPKPVITNTTPVKNTTTTGPRTTAPAKKPSAVTKRAPKKKIA